MTAPATERHANRTRGVAPLLASTAISVTGDGAFIAVAPLLAAALTSSPVAVSTVTAGFYVPWLAFGLPAGALADRWPRRRVMVVADLVRAFMLAALVAAILAGLISVPLLVRPEQGTTFRGRRCFLPRISRSRPAATSKSPC